MRIVGITAEYNLFHNGHLHHLRESLRLAEADGAVAVMSGNYVQRGLPACVDKYRRARMALEAGVDVVIELPVGFALSSAEGFAAGAVTMLQDLGVTDLSYGCEADRAADLRSVAAFLLEEPEDYRQRLKTALKSGKSFPAARQEAVSSLLGPDAASLLSAPNNILGIEYEKALLRLNSPVQSHAVQRNDSGYHAAGTALRTAMEAGDLQALVEKLPETSLKLMDYSVTANDFSPLLSYRLTGETRESLRAAFPDLDPELLSRIAERFDPFLSFEELCSVLTTKNTTRTAVSRALCRILLDLRQAPKQLPFFRVLGFRKDSSILKQLRDGASRPLITKAADLPQEAYANELRADAVYALAVYKKTGMRLPDAFHAGPVII
ncbi:MAG: nucleotidyltransferase family protein [Lachnospiraceae bacterium]|nr:nucleotidyltransferase family protein [Lachnospiraceae bacterium]